MTAKKKIPDQRQREKIVRAKAENPRYAKNNWKIPSLFKIGNIVRFKRPSAEILKDHSTKKRKKSDQFKDVRPQKIQ